MGPISDHQAEGRADRLTRHFPRYRPPALVKVAREGFQSRSRLPAIQFAVESLFGFRGADQLAVSSRLACHETPPKSLSFATRAVFSRPLSYQTPRQPSQP